MSNTVATGMTAQGVDKNENGKGAEPKQESVALDLSSGKNQIAADGKVKAFGQHFQFAATGLWAGAIISFAFVFVVAKIDFPEQRQMMWLLGVALGGLMGTAVMHGRLADKSAELERARVERDRKEVEYQKLLSRSLRATPDPKRRKSDGKKDAKQ